MSGASTDVEAVTAANTGLYDALERGDLDAMAERWLDADISVVHPGWPVISGRGEVMRSYALIMANTEYIQFFLTDVEVAVQGDTALVTCTENILSGGPAEEDGSAGPLVGGMVVATNIFRRTETGEWKVWAHHGSPVLLDQEDDDEADAAEADIDEDDDGDVGGTAIG
ncbi:nuclear transport factor 2 family protein [Streptomyces mayteni]